MRLSSGWGVRWQDKWGESDWSGNINKVKWKYWGNVAIWRKQSSYSVSTTRFDALSLFPCFEGNFWLRFMWEQVREGTFVCVSCNFRQQLQRAAGPHSLQTWPPLNRGQRLAAPCCDIAVSPPGQDCKQASPLNRTLDFSSATFRLTLNAASMTSLVGSPFFLAQNDSQSNYLVLTFFFNFRGSNCLLNRWDVTPFIYMANFVLDSFKANFALADF